MAILNFQKPDKIILQKVTDFEGSFEFRPLEQGYGLTIGNALPQGFCFVTLKDMRSPVLK